MLYRDLLDELADTQAGSLLCLKVCSFCIILPGLTGGILPSHKPLLASTCYWCRIYSYMGFLLCGMCEAVCRKSILLENASCLLKCTFKSIAVFQQQHWFVSLTCFLKLFRQTGGQFWPFAQFWRLEPKASVQLFYLSELRPLCSHHTFFQEAINSIVLAKFHSRGKANSPAPAFSTYPLVYVWNYMLQIRGQIGLVTCSAFMKSPLEALR